MGLLNGCLFAVLAGLVTLVLVSSLEQLMASLGLIIAGAMIINLVVAGIAGVALPILLDKFRIDPAIASGVFVTTITDVVGFFAFLSLASSFLL